MNMIVAVVTILDHYQHLSYDNISKLNLKNKIQLNTKYYGTMPKRKNMKITFCTYALKNRGYPFSLLTPQ